MVVSTMSRPCRAVPAQGLAHLDVIVVRLGCTLKTAASVPDADRPE
jgi:hypothetical protein